MSLGAALFMAGSWLFVLGLMGWSFSRVLRPKPPAEKPAQHNGRAQR